AGPILSHLHAVVINADRGDGVGPVLLHSVPGSSASAGYSMTRSTGRPFDPTMRSEVRGPSADKQRAPAGAAATSTPAAPTDTSAATGQHVGGAATTAGTASTSAATRPMQMQAQGAGTTTTTDSVALSTTPAPARHVAGSTSNGPPYETVWSTSWTTNGTTVYETVWSWSDTVH
ncbi:MAG TPA: hypothetical protein VF892_01525, partial [Pseudonocardiaceae bacterium]